MSKKKYRSHFWVQVFMLLIPVPGFIFILKMHSESSSKNYSERPLILFWIFIIIFTLWAYHESRITLTIYNNLIIYKKGLFPRKIILKKDITKIYKKSVKITKGSVTMITILLTNRKKITIPLNMFRNDMFEILRNFLSS
ncbi:hypothetical protein CH363_05055 [Leptospira haakeii]|uniref:DUF304 domain-containing protein n=1 Tax=Leptospira haakeii TaxID=2023198 RepID=A0ABX4PRS3_9LEPT|nr:hypothetical protein CH363_05055 [Leptospira haakeii]PKA19335.1 hypothetical protein CH377_13545 [Leptospira haakeii]